METSVFNVKGKATRSMDLSAGIFDVAMNKDIMYEVIRAYRASLRAGTASTKTRAEVRGGGKKPWRQKGTGRARAGSIRSPLWRKGGVIFGPRPRSYTIPLPRKKVFTASVQALSDQFKNGNVIIVDLDNIFTGEEKPKTQKVIAMLNSLNIYGKNLLLIVHDLDKKCILALRNIRNCNIIHVNQVHAYAVLDCHKVLITEQAVLFLQKRKE